MSLKVVGLINEGQLERKNYVLHMKEYEVQITEGEPSVKQSNADITQYQQYKWGSPKDLKPAADKGSLCSILFLEHLNK